MQNARKCKMQEMQKCKKCKMQEIHVHRKHTEVSYINETILIFLDLPWIGILIDIPWNKHVPPSASLTAKQTEVTYQTSSKFSIFWKKSISWVYLGKKRIKKRNHIGWILKPDTRFTSTFSDNGEGEVDH